LQVCSTAAGGKVNPGKNGAHIGIASDVINEKDLQLDRLSKMALADPSTSGNPKKLTENDMKVMYQYSMKGELFK